MATHFRGPFLFFFFFTLYPQSFFNSHSLSFSLPFFLSLSLPPFLSPTPSLFQTLILPSIFLTGIVNSSQNLPSWVTCTKGLNVPIFSSAVMQNSSSTHEIQKQLQDTNHISEPWRTTFLSIQESSTWGKQMNTHSTKIVTNQEVMGLLIVPCNFHMAPFVLAQPICWLVYCSLKEFVNSSWDGCTPLSIIWCKIIDTSILAMCYSCQGRPLLGVRGWTWGIWRKTCGFCFKVTEGLLSAALSISLASQSTSSYSWLCWNKGLEGSHAFLVLGHEGYSALSTQPEFSGLPQETGTKPTVGLIWLHPQPVFEVFRKGSLNAFGSAPAVGK